MAHRTLLIVGRTGAGKSTLANVIVGDPLRLRFRENDTCARGTASFQTEEIIISGRIYRVIDTVGFGDPSIEDRDVLRNLAHALVSAGGPIHQIVFVVGGRFTHEEAHALNLLGSHLFGAFVYDHVTVVRTSFAAFRDATRCRDDDVKLRTDPREAGDALAALKKVRKILHVDNPPEGAHSSWRDLRQASRELLLAHLEMCTASLVPDNHSSILERISKMQTVEEQNAARKTAVEAAEQQRKALQEQEREEALCIAQQQKTIKLVQVTLTENQKLLSLSAYLPYDGKVSLPGPWDFWHSQIRAMGLVYVQHLQSRDTAIEQLVNVAAARSSRSSTAAMEETMVVLRETLALTAAKITELDPHMPYNGKLIGSRVCQLD